MIEQETESGSGGGFHFFFIPAIFSLKKRHSSMLTAAPSSLSTALVSR